MKIFILGAGNVAEQLGKCFKKSGHRIAGVWSRNPVAGKNLARKLSCSYFSDKLKINANADIFVIAVSDSAISMVAGKISRGNHIVVHTSGSVSMRRLQKRFQNSGVIYPVQTILRNALIDFRNTPFCIEASNKKVQVELSRLMRKITKKIYVLSSKQRAAVHLAAVFANNFSNYMLDLAYQTLKTVPVNSDILQPLIQSTIQNISKSHPDLLQTGPAKRGDVKTISMHMKLLRSNPEIRRMYWQISKNILHRKALKVKKLNHGKL